MNRKPPRGRGATAWTRPALLFAATVMLGFVGYAIFVVNAFDGRRTPIISDVIGFLAQDRTADDLADEARAAHPGLEWEYGTVDGGAGLVRAVVRGTVGDESEMRRIIVFLEGQNAELSGEGKELAADIRVDAGGVALEFPYTVGPETAAAFVRGAAPGAWESITADESDGVTATAHPCRLGDRACFDSVADAVADVMGVAWVRIPLEGLPNGPDGRPRFGYAHAPPNDEDRGEALRSAVELLGETAGIAASSVADDTAMPDVLVNRIVIHPSGHRTVQLSIREAANESRPGSGAGADGGNDGELLAAILDVLRPNSGPAGSGPVTVEVFGTIERDGDATGTFTVDERTCGGGPSNEAAETADSAVRDQLGC